MNRWGKVKPHISKPNIEKWLANVVICSFTGWRKAIPQINKPNIKKWMPNGVIEKIEICKVLKVVSLGTQVPSRNIFLGEGPLP